MSRLPVERQEFTEALDLLLMGGGEIIMEKYHKIQSVYKRDPENDYQFTDEWSRPEFGYLAEDTWVWTEKVDGTNIRVMWNGENVIFGGRKDGSQIPSFLVNRLNELFQGTPKRKMFRDKFGEDSEVCLYGEGYGKKIQAGGENYKDDGQDFVLFDVKIDDLWLKREDVEDIAEFFSVKVAPVVGEGALLDAIEYTKQGFTSQWGDFTAEGLVLRPKMELLDRRGERVITKVKHRDFQ